MGGYTSPDCTSFRQSFACLEAADVGSGSGSGWEEDEGDMNFGCVDPNPFWLGDCEFLIVHDSRAPLL